MLFALNNYVLEQFSSLIIQNILYLHLCFHCLGTTIENTNGQGTSLCNYQSSGGSPDSQNAISPVGSPEVCNPGTVVLRDIEVSMGTQEYMAFKQEPGI